MKGWGGPDASRDGLVVQETPLVAGPERLLDQERSGHHHLEQRDRLVATGPCYWGVSNHMGIKWVRGMS